GLPSRFFGKEFRPQTFQKTWAEHLEEARTSYLYGVERVYPSVSVTADVFVGLRQAILTGFPEHAGKWAGDYKMKFSFDPGAKRGAYRIVEETAVTAIAQGGPRFVSVPHTRTVQISNVLDLLRELSDDQPNQWEIGQPF